MCVCLEKERRPKTKVFDRVKVPKIRVGREVNVGGGGGGGRGGFFFKHCMFLAAVVAMQCSNPVFMLILSLEVVRVENF